MNLKGHLRVAFLFVRRSAVLIEPLKILLVLPAVILLSSACAFDGIDNRQQKSALTRTQIIEARREFKVEVLSFDTSKRYGSAFPYSDYVRLKVTNDSRITLPYLTPLTKRYSHGRAIGWSRAPTVPVDDLPPGGSKTIDYYPHGHISAFFVDTLTVEIEPIIDEEEIRFFRELRELKELSR